jgi:hypothetical protein
VRLPWLVLALLVPHAARAADFTDDFESGTLAHWGTSRLPAAESASVQEKIVRSGTHAAEILLKPGDPPVLGGRRAELNDPAMARPGSEAWYRFSLFLPAATRLKAGQSCVIAQFHDQSSEMVAERYKNGAHKPPLAFRYRADGGLQITIQRYGNAPALETERTEIARIPAFTLGAWHDFRIRVRWDPKDGAVEIWHRDVPLGTESKIADYAGGVGYRPPEPPTGEGPYFKVGPYCGSSAPPRELTVYFDDYSRSGG